MAKIQEETLKLLQELVAANREHMTATVQMANDIKSIKTTVERITSDRAKTTTKTPRKKEEGATFPRNTADWFAKEYVKDKAVRDKYALHTAIASAHGRAEYDKEKTPEKKLAFEAKVLFDELKKQADKAPYDAIVKECSAKREAWKKEKGHVAASTTSTSTTSTSSTSTSTAPEPKKKAPPKKSRGKAANANLPVATVVESDEEKDAEDDAEDDK